MRREANSYVGGSMGNGPFRARVPALRMLRRWSVLRRSATVAVGVVACVAVVGVAASSAAGPTARAARTLSLNESAHLHLNSSHGFKLNEQGQATGSLRGPIYLYLIVSSTNRVTAEVRVYPHGGYMAGQGSADYRVSGSTASFSGTMSITHGSGTYAHVHGTGLHFSGTIKRTNDAVTVKLIGKLSY
jgi:hypothetical protein